MANSLKTWFKNSESPIAQRLLKLAKQARNPQMFVIPGIHQILFKLHKLIGLLFSELGRIFYYTPMFKSQINGPKKQLYLYSGMPQILGPLKIEVGNEVRMSGITTFCGRYSKERIATLEIGNNVDVGWQNAFSVGTKIQLQDNVRLAGRVFLAGFPGHPIDCDARAKGLPDEESQIGDIIIKEGAWLGTSVTVLAGVTIGRGAIIGAGSVVTKDVPDFTIAAGNPAKVVRNISQETQL